MAYSSDTVSGDELYGEYEFTFVTVEDNRIWAQMSTRGAIFLSNTQGYAIVQCMLEAVGSDLSPSHFATEASLQAANGTYRSTYCRDMVGDATGEAYMNAVKKCYAEQWGETSAVKLSDTAMVVFASKDQTRNTISAFIDPLDSSQLVSSNDDMANLYTGSVSKGLSSTSEVNEYSGATVTTDAVEDLSKITVPDSPAISEPYPNTHALGTYCRNDGACISITASGDDSYGMVADFSGMGDEAPDFSGSHQSPLAYFVQGYIPKENLFGLVTTYQYQWTACDEYSPANCVVGETRAAEFTDGVGVGFPATCNLWSSPMLFTSRRPRQERRSCHWLNSMGIVMTPPKLCSTRCRLRGRPS